MERALRVISVERGVDPSELHLMAFGGAAGLHAAELSERIGARGVLLPPDPGLASAWGMLAAPVVRDRTRTVLLRSDVMEDDARLGEAMDRMEAEARRELEDEGFPPAILQRRREVDARYLGQSWELTVPEEEWEESFHRAHEERYGYRRSTQPVEAVTLRVRVEAPGVEAPGEAGLRAGGEEAAEEGGEETGSPHAQASPALRPPRESAQVTVRMAGEAVGARLLSRAELPTGDWMLGPAVLVEYSATTWCPPGWRLRSTEGGMVELGPSTSSTAFEWGESGIRRRTEGDGGKMDPGHPPG